MQQNPQALEACLNDALGLLHLFKSAALHERAALLFQGFVALGSMYVVESHAAVTTLLPELRHVFANDEVDFLRESRHRAKLLDHRAVTEVARELLDIAVRQQLEFNSEHKGWLAPLKRALQGDVGLSLCDGHLIWTSHATMYCFGDRDVDGENSFAFGHAIGMHLGALLALAGVDPSKTEGEPPELGVIQMRDIKYQAIYSRGAFGKVGPDVGASLALTLAHVNLARHIVGVGSKPPSYLGDPGRSLPGPPRFYVQGAAPAARAAGAPG